MKTLPAQRAPLPVLVDEVLALTANLRPDEALARLCPVWAAAKPGLARRALLAARISLMRQELTVAAPPEALAQASEVAAKVAPVLVPAPQPPVLNKGALTLLNLEDAARMLMAGADDDDAADDSDALDAAIAAGVSEAAETAFKAGEHRSKARMAAPLALDFAAQFAGMEEG